MVEWDGLENRCTGNRTVGSNPTLSANNSSGLSCQPAGCTKEQVSRHLDQVTKSRTAPVSEKRNQNRQHKIDWP